MKSTLSVTGIVACALALAGVAPANGQERTAQSPSALPVGTCINMGNSLEPPKEGEWGGSNISKEDFKRIKDAGFETVRIPVRWHNKSLNTPPYTVDPAWMARVVEVVVVAEHEVVPQRGLHRSHRRDQRLDPVDVEINEIAGEGHEVRSLRSDQFDRARPIEHRRSVHRTGGIEQTLVL